MYCVSTVPPPTHQLEKHHATTAGSTGTAGWHPMLPDIGDGSEFHIEDRVMRMKGVQYGEGCGKTKVETCCLAMLGTQISIVPPRVANQLRLRSSPPSWRRVCSFATIVTVTPRKWSPLIHTNASRAPFIVSFFVTARRLPLTLHDYCHWHRLLIFCTAPTSWYQFATDKVHPKMTAS